jgi:hypothetical protein
MLTRVCTHTNTDRSFYPKTEHSSPVLYKGCIRPERGMLCRKRTRAAPYLSAYVRIGTNQITRKHTVSRISVMRHPGLVTRGMTLATVLPVCTTRSSRSNRRWNGKTRQNVAGLTFGSAHRPNTTLKNALFLNTTRH